MNLQVDERRALQHGPFVLLLLITVAILLPGLFVGNTDLSTISALEVDAGGRMDSIIRMFDTPVYSQHNGYVSKSYGWAYDDLLFGLVGLLKHFGLSEIS